jgi:hypothetical protein
MSTPRATTPHGANRSATKLCVLAAVSAAMAIASCSGQDQPDMGTNQAPHVAQACDSPLVWSRVAGSPAGFRISGSGPADLWLIADGSDGSDGGGPCVPNGPGGGSCTGVLTRGDGTTWNAATDLDSVNSGAPVWSQALSVWVVGHDDVFVGVSGDTSVFRWDGSQWTEHSVDDNRNVDSLWGSGPDDVWGARGAMEGTSGTGTEAHGRTLTPSTAECSPEGRPRTGGLLLTSGPCMALFRTTRPRRTSARATTEPVCKRARFAASLRATSPAGASRGSM